MREYLDLDRKGLENVKNCVEQNQFGDARKHLRNYYKTRNINAFFLEKERVFEFIKDNIDAKTIEVADLLCENTFVFDQPWDMEKCTEKVKFTCEIDWTYVHNADREWMWMLNRQNYWICLMQAYAATENEKYLHTFINQMQHFINAESNPTGKEYKTWRTIDVGIRIKNWVKILEYIIDLDILEEVLFEKILHSIYTQVQYLVNSYRREYALTNWRILEFHGVLIACCYFPEFVKSKEWIQKCIFILTECITLQITNDGFHWEQSYMYHVEMLLCMRDVILICERNKIHLPEILIDITKKMADAVSHMITPKGNQPCYGDSDMEDLRELLSGLSALFDEPYYFYLGKGCKTVNLVCDYGVMFLDKVQHMRGQCPQQLDYAHEDVGNYFARSGWGEKESYLFFKNGFLGSGHGHCDLLHMEIYSRGNPILVDSGRYTYRDNTMERQQFKSARAHNTLLVDGEEFIVQEGSWDNTRTATEIKRPAILNKPVCYLQGAHMGYMEKDVFINRKIVYIKPHIWVIVDECFSSSSHVYQQFYHFATDNVAIKDNSILYQDDRQVFKMVAMHQTELCKESIEISPSYNYKYPSAGVSMTTKGQGNTFMTTICIAQNYDNAYDISKVSICDMNGIKVAEDTVSCYKVSVSSEEWIIMTSHLEENTRRQTYIIEDILVFGRTVVIHKKAEEVKKYVLEY